MNILISNILRLKTSLHNYLNYVRESPEMEDIHKLRVTIRKLKVVYALIKFSLPDEFSKFRFNEALKNLFILAGRVRENQINILSIQKLDQEYLQPYLYYQFRALKRNMRIFKKAVMNFEVDKFDEQCELVLNLLDRFDDAWCLNKVFAYTTYKYEKVDLLKSMPENKVLLHKVRKRVRSIIDALSMLKKNARKNSSVPFAEIKRINDSLGKWHDQVVLVHSLDLFGKRQADQTKYTQLKVYIDRQKQNVDMKM